VLPKRVGDGESSRFSVDSPVKEESDSILPGANSHLPTRPAMIDISKDIRSLTDFKRETTRYLEELKASGRAVVLTVNGEAELAVMSAETFQRVLEAMETLDAIRCIREGLEQGKRGEILPADEFFRSFRTKRGLGTPGP
jgi:PHD/YefM family antitoxin component YafN of YafNO toxin-antitoxin module